MGARSWRGSSGSPECKGGFLKRVGRVGAPPLAIEPAHVGSRICWVQDLLGCSCWDMHIFFVGPYSRPSVGTLGGPTEPNPGSYSQETCALSWLISCARLAQWTERRTSNPEVAGSSPAPGEVSRFWHVIRPFFAPFLLLLHV